MDTRRGTQPGDERLCELIRERLTEDPEIDASDVTIEVSGGMVTLSGSVANHRIKHDVAECVENCGAIEVRNQLTVA